MSRWHLLAKYARMALGEYVNADPNLHPRNMDALHIIDYTLHWPSSLHECRHDGLGI